MSVVTGRVSFVVPTRNSMRTIERCLVSIREQRAADVELVVVDNHSDDGTFDVARRLADVAVQRGPERSAQRNHGASLASGEFVAFIDSDMVLEPDVAQDAVRRFAAPPNAVALVIPELAFGEGPWCSARQLEKELYLGQPSVEAARIFRADAFAQVGGFDESMTSFEDWDLDDRVARVGRVDRVDTVVWHDEGRVVLRTCFAKKRYYGAEALAYTSRPRDDRRALGRTALLGRTPLLARSPIRTAKLAVLKSVEAAGMAAGLRDARRHAAS